MSGTRRGGGGSRALCGLATALALAAGAGAGSRAGAGPLATVRVDEVRVRGGGSHEAWVSVLDGDGLPIPGLGATAFQVSADGRPVEGLAATSWAAQGGEFELAVIADAPLLAGRERAALANMLERLAAALGPGGRLRVVGAGPRPRALAATAGGAGSLLTRLSELGAGGDEVRLYDALHDVVRRLGRRPAGAALVVTRGEDAGSRHGILQVLAASRAGGRHVPVLVVLLEDASPGAEGDRLRRLAIGTGGAAQRIAVAEAASGAAEGLLARSRGAYRLAFRVPDWDAGTPTHILEIAAAHEGVRRGVREEYLTAEALAPAWWRGPWAWLWPVALAVTALLAVLVLRRRPSFVLEVESGPDRGCRYEAYALPLTLGAAEGNDVTFAEPRVSRNHAVLERRGRAIEIVDLNSENGTFVNDERVTRRVLAEGDALRLGSDVELIFHHGG